GKIGGRTHEISRLIGRSLRACLDLAALGENSIVLDCDVLQADGGTRTAAITGAYVALADAVGWLASQHALRGRPTEALHRSVSAVSVGIIGGEPRLDLCYEEDVVADVDMNVVCTGTGDFVEVQGTGEQAVFHRRELDVLVDLGAAGCASLAAAQREALARWRFCLPPATRRRSWRWSGSWPGACSSGWTTCRRYPGARRRGRT